MPTPPLRAFLVIVIAVLLTSALPANTANATGADRTTIARAFCDAAGAHVVYEDGHTVLRRARRGERCTDMRVSEDRRAAAWVMESEAASREGEPVSQRSTHQALFVNRDEIQYEGDGLYAWWFRDNRSIVLEAGPLHGGGNLYLYDIARKRIIDTCLRRVEGTVCPAWATPRD
jgi:hypothetical protein